MTSFKGVQVPKDVILFAVFFFVRCVVSYRDLEEILAERGVRLDHTTLNRWRRNKTAATKVFALALEANSLPRKIVIHRSGANTTGITATNQMLKRFDCPIPLEMVRIKFPNNMIERDHRTIKKRGRPMLGFKSFVSASATLEGTEVANKIRKGQITPGLSPFAQSAVLVA